MATLVSTFMYLTVEIIIDVLELISSGTAHRLMTFARKKLRTGHAGIILRHE